MTRGQPRLVILALAALFVAVLVIAYVVAHEARTAPSPRSGAEPAPFSVASAPSNSGVPTPNEINPNAGDAGPSDGAEPASKSEQPQWEPVAISFARALTTDTGDPRAWRAGLARYSTGALQDQLATVDPRRLPGGRYADHEVVQYDDSSAVIVVTYTTNWAVAISVIGDGDRWKVYQYERWEG